MRQKYLLLVILFLYIYDATAQEIDNVYIHSFSSIDSMLTGQRTLNFKLAVFETESAYVDRVLKPQKLNHELDVLLHLVQDISSSNLISYNDKDEKNITKQASIFKVLTDTIIIPIDSSRFFVHKSYKYDFDDPFGEKDWTNMFVSKLLTTGKGNCHSLPYLYKILAEEMGIAAYLAFAPNHIYIKSYSEKTGWYNTELTSGTFPIDAWIMASGYVTVEAIQNGLYMDTLSTKQSVANCLVDLAQGYQHKFGKDNPDFVVKCCNTCLQYHPTNVNAMLTKAEAQKYYIQAQIKAKNVKTPQQLFANNTIKEMYEDMEQTYVRLHELGYRRMPEEMCKKWISLLKSDPKKYNKPPINIIKK